MPILFALTLFVSALLLFMVQPMIGRMILPLLGGSPATWNTCMVFFQFVLLLGYLYAHKLTTRLNSRQQVMVHAAVLGIAVITFAAAALLTERGTPIAIVKSLAPQSTAYPMLGILALLAVAIGVPFFAVSTTAPLLQRWFANTGHASAKDPYFLYAASNAGSLLSLLAYPLITEPSFTLAGQAWIFAAGFLGLTALIVFCGLRVPATAAQHSLAMNPAEAPTRRRILKWIFLAFVPSSLMLGVTFYMTTDIASIPLLWIIPLALYLLTFIIAFARTPSWLRVVLGNAAPVMTLLLFYIIITQTALGPFVLIVLHLVTFFLLALMCHNELALDRPPPAYLTNFFVWISVGGMLGGVFNALLAPIVFPLAFEYTIALCIGCMLVPKFASESEPKTQRQKERTFIFDLFIPLGFLTVVLVVTALADWHVYRRGCEFAAEKITALLRAMGSGFTIDDAKVRDGFQWALPLIGCFFFIERPIRFGCCVAAVVFVGEFRRAAMEQHYERSFFGIMRVHDDEIGILREPFDKEDPVYYKRTRSLIHGTTLHGKQALEAWPLHDGSKDCYRALFGPWAVDCYDWRQEPLTYYHRTGPVGHAFAVTRERFAHPKVAMVGLGTGSVACYANSTLDLTFFEIDPTVTAIVAERVKDPFFTFVPDAKARGANVEIIHGDARLRLEQDTTTKYDLLLVDAFSSDSIPVHLLTRQALELYLDRLNPGGLLALHISNKFIKLEEVVARLAEDTSISAVEFNDTWYDTKKLTTFQLAPPGKTQSSWVLLSRDAALLETFQQSRFTTQYRYYYEPSHYNEATKDYVPDVPPINRWTPMKADPIVKPWTDDYSDVPMLMHLDEVQWLRRMLGRPIPKSMQK